MCVTYTADYSSKRRTSYLYYWGIKFVKLFFCFFLWECRSIFPTIFGPQKEHPGYRLSNHFKPHTCLGKENFLVLPKTSYK